MNRRRCKQMEPRMVEIRMLYTSGRGAGNPKGVGGWDPLNLNDAATSNQCVAAFSWCLIVRCCKLYVLDSHDVQQIYRYLCLYFLLSIFIRNSIKRGEDTYKAQHTPSALLLHFDTSCPHAKHPVLRTQVRQRPSTTKTSEQCHQEAVAQKTSSGGNEIYHQSLKCRYNFAPGVVIEKLCGHHE